MRNRKLNIWLPFLFSVVMVLGMLAGMKVKEYTWGKEKITRKAQYGTLDEILNLIDVKYVDTVSRKKLVNKLITDLLDQLDPHSFYIAAKDLQRVNQGLQGNFEGIGIEFYILKDTIIVVSPISGGPSESLGIMSGDKIIKIEDTLVAGVGITNEDVIDKLRGPKGTKVNVSIARKGVPELLDFTITRDEIPIYSVNVGYMVDDKTGYIKISRFSANTHKEFVDELKKLKEAGMEKLIIDLRGNPGGYLEAARMIADELLSGKKLIVYTEGKAYQRKDYKSRANGLFEHGELAIIIDEGSASASEILAGAVQDWDRGVIVGRRSFGKGLVQEQYELKDGSAVRLTVARYYTPSGRSIQKPYKRGDDSYNDEIVERFYHGEQYTEDSISLPDSVEYYTSQGRVVYGGGGIIPDVFVPVDTSINLAYFAKVRSYIPEFVYDYYSKNAEKYTSYKFEDYKENYGISDTLFEEFIQNAEDEGLKIDEEELEKLTPEIKTTLKAYIARQVWKDEGFYPVIQEIDKTLQRTIDVLEEDTLALDVER